MKKFARLALVSAALTAASLGAQAQSMYIGVGAPSLVSIGYAQPMGKSDSMGGQWGLRGEIAGANTVSRQVTEEGNQFAAKLKANRVGLFADWFPGADSSFRFVGGITVYDFKLDLNATGASGSIDINGKTATMTANDSFNVSLKYPQITPYFGIGFGHKASTERGLSMFGDLGVSVGKFKSTVTTTLVNPTNPTITQADVDAEAQSLRDAVSQLAVLPNIQVGLVYRF